MLRARLYLNTGVRHRILRGHPWVFASEVDRTEGPLADGDCVEICSAQGQSLGSALYNSRSQIVARRYARERLALDRPLLRERLEQALAFRRRLGGAAAGAERLVWSESDRLPGLVVDRYGSVLVLQTLTLGLAQRQEEIVGLLEELTGAPIILARNDAPVRQLEGLPLERQELRGRYHAPTAIRMAGLQFELDLWRGQKTGFYLDQARNYEAIARYAPGRRLLDCFCNQGAFALVCARAGASSCRAIEQSAEALLAADATGRREGLTQIDWVEANVFDYLRQAEQRRDSYDLIVLDPPSFTKSKGNITSALRGYHELHLRALRLLPVGGILATFSCSHHVTAADWEELLGRAAEETGSTLRLRERLGPSPDHPILVNVPETEYLRGYVVEKV